MATGDLKNSLGQLRKQLRLVGYSHDLNLNGITKGLPTAYLPIYHYVFASYSPHVSERVIQLQVPMLGASDRRFIQLMYKVLRELFAYKPAITQDQFFSPGFLEHKVIMATEIISRVHELHETIAPVKPIKKPKKSFVPQMKKMEELRDSQSVAADPPTDTDPLDGEDMGTAVAVITPRATLPNVRVTRNTDDGETARMKAIEEHLAGLTVRLTNMENRLAQMEHIPANQTHDQPQTDKFDARQLENILARLILMESRIGAVEKKNSRGKPCLVMGMPTSADLKPACVPQNVAAEQSFVSVDLQDRTGGPQATEGDYPMTSVVSGWCAPP